MYSQDEINSAIEAGVLSEEAALNLRAHVVQIRERPVTDEEHFRLVSSFNDIFVAIGVVIMLFAVGAIGQAIGGAVFPAPDYDVIFGSAAPQSDAAWADFQRQFAVAQGAMAAFAGALVAGTAWFLAEFFTRKRRMALPSIILLIAFVGGVFALCVGPSVALIESGDSSDRIGAILFSVSGIVAAIAGWLHWRRFNVPIAVAAGAGALAVTAVGLILAAVGPDNLEKPENLVLGLVLAAGLAIFVLAMRWDTSDRTRQTRRADVAFWLHLLAAPMIAHPVFYALGVTEGDSMGIAGIVGVVAVYVVFGMIALAIDRRALLVSALAYVLIALTIVFDRFGAVELSFALTALVIGSALLTLSAFWSPIRKLVVEKLPGGLQMRLPVTSAAMATA